LLYSLQRYYTTVKTKRQLQLEVPAGFRQMSNQNKDLTSYLRSQRSEEFLSSSLTTIDSTLNTTSIDPSSSLLESDTGHNLLENMATHSSSISDYVPIIRSVGKTS
jgi:hypothetical protein